MSVLNVKVNIGFLKFISMHAENISYLERAGISSIMGASPPCFRRRAEWVKMFTLNKGEASSVANRAIPIWHLCKMLSSHKIRRLNHYQDQLTYLQFRTQTTVNTHCSMASPATLFWLGCCVTSHHLSVSLQSNAKDQF
jgi:hypothetical protein